MKLMKKIPFAFEENSYEIRILFGNNTITIAAFYQNHPANCYRHSIKMLKHFDPEKIVETEAVKELVEISRNDIIEKKQEKLMKVFENEQGV